MTDATAQQSSVSRWVLVTFTTIIALATLWLAAHLDTVCAADVAVSNGCDAESRTSAAIAAAIGVLLVAVLVIVVTYLAPEEVRGRVFGPLYALLLIVALGGIGWVVVSAGFTIPPTFTFE